MTRVVRTLLTPNRVLRAAVNLSNPLLITSRQPLVGVAPSLAAALAARLDASLEMVEYEHPDHICAAADAWSAAGSPPSEKPWDVALIAAE